MPYGSNNVHVQNKWTKFANGPLSQQTMNLYKQLY